MKVQEQIDRLNEIYKDAYMKTPSFLRGILIPSHNVEEFQMLMHFMMDGAKRGEEYWKQIVEATHLSQEATHEFMTALVKGVKDGTIKFGGK